VDRNGFLLVCLQDEHLMIDKNKNKNKPMSNSEGGKREREEEREERDGKRTVNRCWNGDRTGCACVNVTERKG